MKNTHNVGVQSPTKPFRGKKYLALAALLLVPAASTFAQSFWSGGTSDFNVAGSWSGTYIGGSNPNCANDSGSNNVVLIQTGDPLWQHGDTLAGQGAGTSGSYLQTGSTNNTGGGNWMRLGIGTGSVGFYTLSNGVVNCGGQTHIGENGSAFMQIAGGTYNQGVNGGNPFCAGDGDFGNGTIGTLLMTGGTLTSSSEIWFGEANSGRVGTGHFIMHGGIINANNWFVFGRFGAAGDGFMDGGTINKSANGNWQMAVGTTTGPIGAQATFTQVGGTINCLSEYQIATDNNLAVCTNNIGGNAVLNVGNWFAIGRAGGMGTLNISGNAAITKTAATGGNVTIAGDGGTPVGVINQNGGTFTNTATQTWIAETWQGYWNLTNGAAVLGVIHLTQNAGANGTFNLDGGNLTATEIYDNNTGVGTLNLNGGTLHVGTPVANPWIHNVNGGVNLQAGGANIDTAGNNATISQALVDGGGGGLTKTGNGILTLSGANSYTGPTLVSAGTLATTAASSAVAAYTVADNAGLSVIMISANAQFSPASVTLGSSTGATVGFDLGGFGNPSVAALNIVGNLAVNGTIMVNIADTLPQLGQFPLIKYGTKSGSGTFTIGAVPVGVVASIVNNTGNHSIDLNITSVALDLWNGLAGGTWDINVTTNWSNAGTGLPTTYLDGISVVFNDTALGSTVVNLVTNVQPRTITVMNDASNYTLVGSGKINGTIGLNKQGAATFAIYNTNGFTGPMVLSGGTLVVSNLANGGAISAIGASSANPTNLVMNGGALSYSGAPLTINRGYNLTYNYNSNAIVLNNTLDLQSDLTLTGPATAAAGSSFVKSGPGKLTYSGTGSNELSGGAFPGYNIGNGTVVFNGQTNHSQNEFWVGGFTNAAGALVLTNATLNVDSWFSVSRGNGTNGYLATVTLYNSHLKSGATSYGYDGGIAGNLAEQLLTLNGNSTFQDNGDFNLGESAGSSATMIINDNSWVNTPNRILMGMSTGATGTVMIANSGTLTNGGWVSIGDPGVATATLKDNAVWQALTDFNVTDVAGNPASPSIGTLNITNNATLILNTLYVGKSTECYGTVNQSGGLVQRGPGGGDWRIGGNVSGAVDQFGTYNLSGGILNIGNANFQVGAYGTGEYNQSGGTAISSGGYPDVGRFAGGVGTFNLSGGTFSELGTGNFFIVGEAGTGTLNVSGTGTLIVTNGLGFGWTGSGVGTLNFTNGSITIYNSLILGQAAGGQATANLYGGTLATRQIVMNNAGASSYINFYGTSLQALPGANLNFMSGLSSATIYATLVLDTGINKIDIAQDLQDGGTGGGLTKNGNGTLLLDGANSYSGNTTVTAGTLGGSGTITGPVVVNAGATLSPGASIGTLTLISTLNLAAGSETVMEVNKTASTSDLVTGASAITYGGTLVLKNLSGALQVGDTFTLFTAGSYSGSFSGAISQTPNQTVTWDLSKLNVDGSVKVATAVAAPVTLNPVVSGGKLNLSWPANQIGWELQEQINPLTVGISTNWVAVPGSTATNAVSLPLDVTEPTDLFRLVFPQQ